jgi:hypothetical protein
MIMKTLHLSLSFLLLFSPLVFLVFLFFLPLSLPHFLKFSHFLLNLCFSLFILLLLLLMLQQQVVVTSGHLKKLSGTFLFCLGSLFSDSCASFERSAHSIEDGLACFRIHLHRSQKGQLLERYR